MKSVSVRVDGPGLCKVITDPSNPDVLHIEALLSFAEASKLAQGNANVRDASEKKKPFKAMMHTVETAPRQFHLRNRGITYITSNAAYDPKSQLITIPAETKLKKWGIADGGHTFEVISQTMADIEAFKDTTDWTLPYVQVKFIVMPKSGFIESIVEGRNTSLQVQQFTLDEYNDRFADLKLALTKVGLGPDLVSYRENEDKEWNVVEIVQRLGCFLRDYWITVQPVVMYKSKGKALRLFTGAETHKLFTPLMGSVLKDVVTLPEFIQAEFSRGHMVKSRKFGRLKSVTPLDKPMQRAGTDLITNHRMDTSVLLPMAAAFRELLELKKNGEYKWKLPYKQVFRACAADLYQVLVTHTVQAKQGGHVGSDQGYWGACLHTVIRTKEKFLDKGYDQRLDDSDGKPVYDVELES